MKVTYKDNGIYLDDSTNMIGTYETTESGEIATIFIDWDEVPECETPSGVCVDWLVKEINRRS